MKKLIPKGQNGLMVKPAEKEALANQMIQKEKEYQAKVKSGEVPWWKRKVSGLNLSQEQKESEARGLADAQIEDKYKSTGEKVKDFAIDAGLAIAPELAIGKIGSLVRNYKTAKGLVPRTSKALYNTIGKEAERRLAPEELSMLRNELSTKGILDVQKTTESPAKEFIRKTIEPYGYGNEASAITNNRYKDLWYYIMNKEVPTYKIPESSFNISKGTRTTGKFNLGTTEEEPAKVKIRNIINDRFKNRFDGNSLQGKNRYTTWDMYLGKAQKENPMYEVSHLSTNKEPIYTIKEDFMNKRSLEKQFQTFIDRVDPVKQQELANAPKVRIKRKGVETLHEPMTPGFQNRAIDKDQDYFGTMGGFSLEHKPLPSGQHEFLASDIWDLHPFQDSSNLPKFMKNAIGETKMKFSGLKNAIEGIEVGKATGIGKPLNVKVGFIYDPVTKKIVKTYGGVPLAIGAGAAKLNQE